MIGSDNVLPLCKSSYERGCRNTQYETKRIVFIANSDSLALPVPESFPRTNGSAKRDGCFTRGLEKRANYCHTHGKTAIDGGVVVFGRTLMLLALTTPRTGIVESIVTGELSAVVRTDGNRTF